MSKYLEFSESKGLAIFLGICLVALLIAHFSSRSGPSKHTLPQVQSEDFERVVLQSEKPTLVDFYADWCGPCHEMEPILVEFARENSGVNVVQVNVDDNAALADQFQINGIPAFLIFQNGKLAARQSGGTDKESLKKWVERSTIPTPAK
jgi:thioredoxin